MNLPAYRHPMQQQVALFHRAFGMPDLIETPGALPADRIDLRLSLIHEEGVVELQQAIAAQDTIQIIDALIDTIYVALGALVEMGQQVRRLPRSARYPQNPMPLIMNAEPEAKYISEPLEQLTSYLASYSDPHTAAEGFSMIARSAYSTLAYSGINPRPFFAEVQRSNMSKLGADGRPIHSRGIELDGFPEGKVLKGPNYSPPDLTAVLDHVGVRRRA